MIADHLFPVPRVQLDADGVAHGARGQKQRSLLAEHLGDALFKLSDGGILAVNVVADLGLGHGAPHGGESVWSRYRCADRSYEFGENFVRKQNARGGQPQRRFIGFQQSIPNETFDRRLESGPVALQSLR